MRGAALVLGFVLVATQGHAQRDVGLETLLRLGDALRTRTVWRATYSQHYVAAGMSSGERVDGTVFVSWPDRALFVADLPTVRLMGLEGRTVRLVDPGVPSCDQHVLNDDEWARMPLATILDPSGAVQAFTVLASGSNGFVLVPRQPGGVDRVEVVLDDRNLPAAVLIRDPQGTENRFSFSGWTPVQGPPEGGWLPTAPAGIACVGDQ